MTRKNVAFLFHQIPSQTWFRNTLMFLGQRFEFVSSAQLAEFFDGQRTLQRACHISFDDGHHSFATQALPVLRELNIPATLFISPRIIRDEQNYWFQNLDHLLTHVGETKIRQCLAHRLQCTVADFAPYALFSVLKALPIDVTLHLLEEIKAQHPIPPFTTNNIRAAFLKEIEACPLLTLGAHTLTHPILANEDDARAAQEILESIKELETWTGKPVTTFAYPNGAALDQGQREKNLLKAAGIKLAFTTQNQFFGPKTDRFFIPRPGLAGSPRETPQYLRAKLALIPWWDLLSPSVRREKRERIVFREKHLGRSA